MTYAEGMTRYNTLRSRAEHVSLMIRRRAQTAFDLAFYGQMFPKETGFPCFHLAHNWASLPTLTPEQRSVCRLMKHLEAKSFEPYRLADAFYRRTDFVRSR